MHHFVIVLESFLFICRKVVWKIFVFALQIQEVSEFVKIINFFPSFKLNSTIFILYNSGTNYSPGDTLEPLRNYLEETNEASGVNIRLERKNVFCFDNEAFRYLMIVKDKKKPSHFLLSSDEVRQFEDSWLQSRDSSNKLIEYVDSLEPMQISDLVTFETAKQSNQEWALRTRETIEQLLNIKVKKLNFEVDIPNKQTGSRKVTRWGFFYL